MKEKLKKFLSLVLAILMVFSITYGMDFTAYGNVLDNNIAIGDVKTVTITDDETVDFVFTPQEDIAIRFYSYDNNIDCDPIVLLYAVTSGDEDYLTSSDNDDTNNFLLDNIDLVGGNTYLFRVGVFSGCPGTYKVALEEVEKVKIDGAKYRINEDGTAELEKYEGDATSFSIPRTISYKGNNYVVTSVGIGAFSANEVLETVNIPGSINRISTDAFSDCIALKAVTIENGVKEIGADAFECCYELESIVIPDSVIALKACAFYMCRSLKDVTLSKNIEIIDYNIFEGCSSLEEIVIPQNVKIIYDRAFYNCTSLTSITLPDSLEEVGITPFFSTGYYNNESNWTGDMLIKDGVLLAINPEATGVLEIPNNVKILCNEVANGIKGITGVEFSKNIKVIPFKAFYECDGIESVTIPANVEVIQFSAFECCDAIKKLVVQDGVKRIESGCFSYCSSLNEIDIPTSIESTSSEIFSGTAYYGNENNWNNGALCISDILFEVNSFSYGLEGEYTVEDGIRLIADGAFGTAGEITKVNLPSSVKIIGSSFMYCHVLEEVVMKEGLERISDNAFYGSPINKIHIPSSVKSIGYCAFEETTYYKDESNWDGDNLYIDNCLVSTKTKNDDVIENLTFKDGTRVAADNIYYYYLKGIKNVVIPSSMISIPTSMFEYTPVNNITIPVSIKEIGDNAFADSGIENIEYESTSNDWKLIKIGKGNTELGSANITYNECYYEHSYDKGKITKQPTCTLAGTKILTCINCGNKKTISVDKKAHTYKDVVTKATSTKNGKIAPTCSICKSTKATTVINKIGTVKLSKASYTYDGKAKKPAVIIKDSKGKTISSKYYTISYPKGRKNVGTYKVKVTFKGNYSGTKTLSFKIVPKSTNISKVTAGSKKFTAKWKKQSLQTTGYEIQYSTNKNFKKAKTTILKNNKTIQKTISKLKAKKKYYVRIRTYKTIKGKKYCSSWSKTKTVTTKR